MNRKTGLAFVVLFLFFSFLSFASEDFDKYPSDANGLSTEKIGRAHV